MTDMARKREGKHSITFWLALFGVFALMGLYVWFVYSWLGGVGSQNDIFNSFYEKTEFTASEITGLSEYEISLCGEDDTQSHTIEASGEKQEMRDKILPGTGSAETYVSPVNNVRCARYIFTYYDKRFVVIYDNTGAAQHTGERDYSALVGENIAVIMTDDNID